MLDWDPCVQCDVDAAVYEKQIEELDYTVIRKVSAADFAHLPLALVFGQSATYPLRRLKVNANTCVKLGRLCNQD